MIGPGSSPFVVAPLRSACTSQPAPPGPDLTADPFRSPAVGNKLHYAAADRPGLTAEATYGSVGTLNGTWAANGSGGHVSETWALDGNRVCNTDKQEGAHCVTLRQNGNGFAEVNGDGMLHGTDTVVS